MSHELRTRLNTIIGFAKLLGEQRKRHHQDGQIVEYADLIRDAATHLLAVINDILDISKLQSGKYSVDTKEVDVDEVLELALAALKPAALARGILLESELEPLLPTVRGDAGKLRQVFIDLISNSIKFARAGGSVTVNAKALADGAVSVRICDTGVGMTKAEVASRSRPSPRSMPVFRVGRRAPVSACRLPKRWCSCTGAPSRSIAPSRWAPKS
jgi:two-component system, cell cycle sensor histidine kinase PleC